MITTQELNLLAGAKVYDGVGEKIGSVGQVYLDGEDGHPAWVAVRTGWFGTNESFVPLDAESHIEGHELHVAAMKDEVRNAPQVERESGNLSEGSAAELDRYYYNLPAGKFRGRTEQQAAKAQAGLREPESRTTAEMPTRGADEAAMRDRPQNLNLTRYEEQLRTGKEEVETGKVRLRKHVVTENVDITVPVSHEEVRVERRPIDRPGAARTADDRPFAEETAEVTLHEERPSVAKETVPVEQVGLVKETRTEQRHVKGTVRKEQIDVEDDRSSRDDRRR
ncbi:MAG: PRC and DUF2382 domain-containing protein [Hamadaea sp.]|uniref:PRC and DUF2382 domain-containing protein n=1 Tax=Hamadaea sp. TaxID=2024425 RepID=UPI0017D9C9FF|nr:PRC and DUF2382 domain-containing protein [Hamadaea sp.]NUT20976.1 PRC and DUF2382 domain-containing protein [Hamadaea sp.]